MWLIKSNRDKVVGQYENDYLPFTNHIKALGACVLWHKNNSNRKIDLGSAILLF